MPTIPDLIEFLKEEDKERNKDYQDILTWPPKRKSRRATGLLV